jgi:hypothetical protein
MAMTLEHVDTAFGFIVILLLLSMLITVIVQMIIAILGLRGRVLGWGVEQLLRQVDPTWEEHAKVLARKILKHRTLSHVGVVLTRYQHRATAIRSDEMIKVLPDILVETAGLPADAPGTTGPRAALRKQLTSLAADSATPLAQRSATAAQALATAFPGQAAELGAQVAKAQSIIAGVEDWFDTVMDRTTERFTLYARWWTAGVAVLLALIFHIDTLQILDRISKDNDLRSKLVQMADGTVRQAENFYVSQHLEKTPIASRTIQGLARQLDDSNVAKQVPEPREVATRLADVPKDLQLREEGSRWLTRSANLSAAAQGPVKKLYDSAFTVATKDWIGQLADSATAIRAQLGEAGFPLASADLSLKDYTNNRGRLIGVLISAILLSLGAPFWFNALRQLANLRPILAGKVDKDQAADAK